MSLEPGLGKVISGLADRLVGKLQCGRVYGQEEISEKY
jgi:hypothetical protein